MKCIVLALALLAAGSVDASVMQASATLGDCEWKTGATCTITVDVSFAKSFAGTRGGIPAPLLQIEVPACAQLEGEVLDTHEALKKNGFLQAPYERLIEDTPATIAFKLKSAPESDDAFYLNVIAYAARDDPESAIFERQRLKLPLRDGARAESVDSTNSEWGVADVLQIGERADPFTLPSADGESVSLSDFAGKKNVIVTTYRAHW